MYKRQVVLRNCGKINPENIDEYLAVDGYKAIEKVLKTMKPEEVIEEIKISGLRGRGGAGFPTWFKWNAAKASPGKEKYLVCNADEGDPGAFMDRSVLEGDPHSLLEGMIIGGYAMGASQGVIYCRAEYPLAIKRLEIAMAQARERGYLEMCIRDRPNAEDMAGIQQLYTIMAADPLTAQYLQAEMRFSLMMKDVYGIIGEAIGVGDLLG